MGIIIFFLRNEIFLIFIRLCKGENFCLKQLSEILNPKDQLNRKYNQLCIRSLKFKQEIKAATASCVEVLKGINK